MLKIHLKNDILYRRFLMGNTDICTLIKNMKKHNFSAGPSILPSLSNEKGFRSGFRLQRNGSFTY